VRCAAPTPAAQLAPPVPRSRADATTLTPRPLNRNDPPAESKLRWHNAFAAEGISVPTAAVLCKIHFHCYLPERLTDWCRFHGDLVTEAECRVALEECLQRGWVQLIDQPARARIVSELRRTGIYGPVGGLPRIGGVDFTAEGAATYLRVRRRANPERRDVWRARETRQHLANYFPSAQLARRWCEEALSSWARVVAGPTPIGSWGNYANCWRVNTVTPGYGAGNFAGTHSGEHGFDGEYCWADTFRIERHFAEDNSSPQLRPLFAPPAGRRVVSRTVPLGRWCIRWWEHFETGVRLEFEIGDPSATDANVVQSS
jgi:hypothetical protein